MSRTIQDAVAEIKAAFPECQIGYTIEGLTRHDIVNMYSEDANGVVVKLPQDRYDMLTRIPRNLCEDPAFDVVRYIRGDMADLERNRRPLDGMSTKGSG